MSILLPSAGKDKLADITQRFVGGFSPEAQKAFDPRTLGNIIIWVHGRLRTLDFGWPDDVGYEYGSRVHAGYGAEYARLRVFSNRILGLKERFLPGETKTPEITVITPDLLPDGRQRIVCTAVPEDTVCHIMPLSEDGMFVDRGLTQEPPVPPRLSRGNVIRVLGPEGYRTVMNCASPNGPSDIVIGVHRAVFATYFFRQKPLAED